MNVIVGIVGGILFALLGTTLLVLLAAPHFPIIGPIGFFVLWVVGIAIALQSPRAGMAWRRLLIASAVGCLLFVFSSLVWKLAPGVDRIATPSVFILGIILLAIGMIADRARGVSHA